jgi:metallo-beta-lactamase family protein
MKLTFLGASRQVTGSCYSLEAGGSRIMIDCGLVQEREYLSRNWERCPIDESSFDAMLLTHIHLDHCGRIPKMVRDGFKAPIYATAPSIELVEIMLFDAAHIQEEEASYKKRRHKREGREGPHPVVPLYTTRDVDVALPLFKPVAYSEPLRINDTFSVIFHDAGHILGSAMLEITVTENGEDPRTVLFSGDIGQWDRPLVGDPTLLEKADYVIMESTYGDRDHIDAGDIEGQIGAVIRRTVERGGNVVIPVFAVDRAQQLMFHISKLVRADRIPDIPIYLDSPMAVDVTEVYRHYPDCLDEESCAILNSTEPPLRFPGLRLVRHVEDSKAINLLKTPCVIMSASGMCTAGRIKHHLRNNISSPENTILFVGFQANGTLGRSIVDGEPEVRIHGENYRVRAEIAQIHGASAHADRSDLMRWLGNLKEAPRRVFLTHGEEFVSLSLAAYISDQLGWQASTPAYCEEVELF